MAPPHNSWVIAAQERLGLRPQLPRTQIFSLQLGQPIRYVQPVAAPTAAALLIDNLAHVPRLAEARIPRENFFPDDLARPLTNRMAPPQSLCASQLGRQPQTPEIGIPATNPGDCGLPVVNQAENEPHTLVSGLGTEAINPRGFRGWPSTKHPHILPKEPTNRTGNRLRLGGMLSRSAATGRHVFLRQNMLTHGYAV